VRDALSLRGGQIRDKTRSAVRQRCKVTRASGNIVYLRTTGWRSTVGALRWWACLSWKPDILRFTTRGLARERRAGSSSRRISAVTHRSASSRASGGKSGVARGRSASGPQ
jgi:hypothetical protein